MKIKVDENILDLSITENDETKNITINLDNEESLAELEKLIEEERKLEIVGESDSLAKRLNFKFYESIYDWAEQKSFSEIIDDSGIEEGIMVKMIKALVNNCSNMQQMAMVVGDNSLSERLEKLKGTIDRGIVKM